LQSLVEQKIFSLDKVYKDDERISDLMKRCYMLINIVDTKIEIPHSFSDYWIFVLNLNESIQDFLTGNISEEQVYTLPKNSPLRKERQKNIKYIGKKFFIAFKSISLKILNHPLEIHLTRKRKLIDDYFVKNNLDYNVKAVVNEMRSQKKNKPGLFEASLSELTIDISDYCDEAADTNYMSKIMKFIKKCDHFSN